MSRELKFRAWDSERREMLVVDELRLNNSDGNAHVFVKGRGWLSAGAGTVMQFTGLRDKNGKEIYEGDTISMDLYGDTLCGYQVTYCGNQDAGLGMFAGYYFQRDDFESWGELEARCTENGDNYEIIGNIYQNPELLKKD